VSEGRGFGEKRLGGRRTEEGKIGGGDPGNGEEWRRHGPEVEREGVHFDGRMEKKWGTTASGGAPFKRHHEKQRKGVHGAARCVEGGGGLIPTGG
jgi:hypothetical protein